VKTIGGRLAVCLVPLTVLCTALRPLSIAPSAGEQHSSRCWVLFRWLGYRLLIWPLKSFCVQGSKADGWQ
jgi:hypothetical protein